MALTKRYLRQTVANMAGDYEQYSTTEVGAVDGSTIVLSALNGRENDADRGKWVVVEFSDSNVRTALITASSGPPDPSNPANYTLSLTPPLGQQVITGLTVEIMAYNPAWYTSAVNTAVQNIFPWLYTPLYNAAIVIGDPSVVSYPLPNGTAAVAIAAYAVGTPSLVRTVTPHHAVVGQAITISGCDDAGMNGAAVVASVPTIFTFTATGADATVAGTTGGTLSLPTDTVDGNDVTRVQMTGQANTPQAGIATYELADYAFQPVGPGNVTYLVLNQLGAPFAMALNRDANIVLIGWQHLSGVAPETQTFRLQNDVSTTQAPELTPGSQFDILLREWVLAYLFRTLMTAPSTPDRAAFGQAFQTQMAYAQQQATAHMMPRPQRRRAQ